MKIIGIIPSVFGVPAGHTLERFTAETFEHRWKINNLRENSFEKKRSSSKTQRKTYRESSRTSKDRTRVIHAYLSHHFFFFLFCIEKVQISNA